MGYEKHAWILLFVVGLYLAIIGGSHTVMIFGTNPLSDITGLNWDAGSPQTDVAIGWLKTISQWIFFSSVVFMAIAAVPYKKGERWAWYLMWALPVNLVVGTLRELANGLFFWPLWFPMVVAPTVVAILGLVLPYRKFFPRK